MIYLITSCDNQKWRRTILNSKDVSTHQGLPSLLIWGLILLPFTRSSYDNFWFWGQEVTRPEVNFTEILHFTVDIRSLNNISKNHYKYFNYQKKLRERKTFKLCSFSLLTGSCHFCFRWDWCISKFQIRCYNVMQNKFQKRKVDFYEFFFTSYDDRKWRQTILPHMVLPTNQDLLLI